VVSQFRVCLTAGTDLPFQHLRTRQQHLIGKLRAATPIIEERRVRRQARDLCGSPRPRWMVIGIGCLWRRRLCSTKSASGPFSQYADPILRSESLQPPLTASPCGIRHAFCQNGRLLFRFSLPNRVLLHSATRRMASSCRAALRP